MEHKFVVMQEVDTGVYRIIELYMSSDGPRSRLCSFGTMKLDEARENVRIREEKLNQGK